MREREDTNRTRVAGSRDGVEGVVTSTLNLFRNGAVGFIGWLGHMRSSTHVYTESGVAPMKKQHRGFVPSERAIRLLLWPVC